MNEIQSIVHPTDFSDMSSKAFVHALRIALAARCRLYFLHVAEHDNDQKEVALPHVRRILTQWGLMDEDDPPSAVDTKLGIHVENVRLDRQHPGGWDTGLSQSTWRRSDCARDPRS